MDEKDVKRNRATVSLALVDNNVSVGTTLCGSFRVMGYGKIKLIRDVAGLEAALHGPGFDLIIGSADIEDGAFLELVKRLRNGDVGRNPFTAVIVTTWSRSWATVRRAIDSGADDVLLSPVSPGGLSDHIQAIVGNRKPFIVTADYTGPERRRDPTRVSTIPAFHPPNTLSEKERGRLVDEAELKWRIDQSAREMAAEKLRRLVFQLAFLQGLAETALDRDGTPEAAMGHLSRLRTQAQRTTLMARVNAEPELAKHTAKMISTVEEMSGRAPLHTGLSVLRREADKLLSKVLTEKPITKMRADVDVAVRMFEQRRQAQMAAAE
jgi:DNA-binding response OmpR family regulator